MPGLLPLQQKLLALLQGTITFFATTQPQSVQDRKMVDQQRTEALRLAEEAARPAFEPFLAYLLSTTAIDAHYPLQTIRFLAIVARAARMVPELSRPQIDELITGAYFSDIGFRAAWLGQKGSHSELTAFRLKEMDFPWYTPALEKMILAHHSVADDPSPQHLLSLTAIYLASVYGLGVDVGPPALLSPVKALEALIQTYPMATDGIRTLLRSLSAYPLGSWVQANTGQVGLVIGANAVNPLRPRIGYCVGSPQGVWRWQEHALEQEPRVHLQRELHPTAAQLNFVNLPQLWIAGWQGQGALTREDYRAAFGAVTSTDGSVSTSPAVEDFLSTPSGLSGSPPVAPAVGGNGSGVPPLRPMANLPGPSENGSENPELRQLRAEWEKHVHLIEESVNHLRHGLMESYQRENKQFREELESLKRRTHTSSPGEANVPSDDRAMEVFLAGLEAALLHEEATWREQHAGLEELCTRVRSALASLVKTRSGARDLAVLVERWQSEWDRIAGEIIDPLHTLPDRLSSLKAACAAARGFVNHAKTRRAGSARTAALWAGRYRPALEHAKMQADTAQRAELRRIERVQQLAQRYLELALTLANR